MTELLDRLHHQIGLPPPHIRICRGRMFSHVDYRQAVEEWGFADVGLLGVKGFAGGFGACMLRSLGVPVYNVAYGIEKPTGRPYALLKIG